MCIRDSIETLRRQWVPPPTEQKTDCFKRLHHPENGHALLAKALDFAPAPFGAYFSALLTSLYAELETTIRRSVWVPSKASAQGVLVKNAALQAETLKSWPDFTAEVMRALRNAHHGYLTSEDAKQARPSRYLSLVTCLLYTSRCV